MKIKDILNYLKLVYISIMPQRSLHACSEDGCLILTRESKCPLHTRKRWELDTRASSAERGYSYTWQKIRRIQLSRYPLCYKCKELHHIIIATIVHHIDEDTNNNHPDNLMSLCRDHHETIHGRIKE